MGSAGDDTFKAIRTTLEPYVRPREEVTRIRQILAAHLDSCLKDASVVGSLALAGTDSPEPSPTARGLQREYLEALSANIRARNELAAFCRQPRQAEAEPPAPGDLGSDRLREHLAAIRLRQRHEKLRAIEKGLDSLAQKPAASPGFLDPEQIFKDSRPLPDVPKELVAALTLDKAAAGPQLKDTLDQLEKHVLQARLLLRREEQLLERAKRRSAARPEGISEGAKLEALNRTRAELINWIEAELGKASGDEAAADGQDGQKQRGPAEPIHMEEQLASIREKYTKYLEARKSLLQLVGEQPKPAMRPPTEEKKPAAPPAPQPPPAAHLLSPYLERLLSIAQEQKGLIAHKSHLNAAIAKQLKENGQVLDHLAEESQLLPAHPMPGAPPPHAAFGDGVAAADDSLPSGRVKPWIFAAESAKISTLEAVAEKIEEGQVALEGSVRTLGEINQLLGKRPDDDGQDGGGTGGTGEDDVWLAEGQPSRAAGTRRHTIRKADKPAHSRTAWDMLDGNLGLLRSDRDTP